MRLPSFVQPTYGASILEWVRQTYDGQLNFDAVRTNVEDLTGKETADVGKLGQSEPPGSFVWSFMIAVRCRITKQRTDKNLRSWNIRSVAEDFTNQGRRQEFLSKLFFGGHGIHQLHNRGAAQCEMRSAEFRSPEFWQISKAVA